MNARTSAASARTGRMTSAISRAQKLWIAEHKPFALSGLADPEPWPEPVALVELLDGLMVVINRYLHVDDHGAHTLALWIVHAWSVEWASSSPRLAIISPPSAAGKTTTLRLIGGLAPRPLMLAPSQMSILLRTIDLVHPTLLIDDADTWALPNRRLRALLATGHARDAVHLNPAVHAFESVAWSCFTPCVLAISGRPPADLAKRCISVAVAPALPQERRETLLPNQMPPVFAQLRARAVRWVQDQGREAATRAPQLPHGLHGSSIQNWRPLLAIAECADVDWVQRARAAAQTLTAAHVERSLDFDLLADVRAAFGKADRMTTDALLKFLLEDHARPWRRAEHGRPLDARALAQRLRPYGVRPRVIRIEPDGFARGYMASDFGDVFERYMDSEHADQVCVHT